MIFDGIKLINGSEFENLVVDSGSTFPPDANEGELFYRNDGANEGLYIYNGATWIKQLNSADNLATLLPNSGVSAGTYRSVTVDTKGRVTAGTNPTTLAGYGITDAQALDADLTAIAALAGSSGVLRKTALNTWTLDTNSYLTQNNSVNITGDATGSGQTSIALTLASTGVTAGTYRSVTVDAKGRVTAATNPTTIAGYGLTDAQALDADLTAIAAISATAGLLRKTATNTWSLDTNVYLTQNNAITVTGDVTGSGQTAINLVLGATGVAAGSYKIVTVDTKGRVTAGSNPTTLSGFGITDAQPLAGDLTAIAALAGTSGLLRKTAVNTWALDTNGYITQNNTITISGDGTGSGQTAITLTLNTTGVAAGSYGTAAAVPTISVDSKGRVTAATNTAIAIDTSAVTTGVFANARISQASVTQHQAALSISETQIADGTLLARVNANEIIAGSWTFNNPVVGTTPTAGNHLTTKDYVDNIAAGVSPQSSVKAATTANITLSGTQTIDGIAVAAGSRVLVKNQTAGAENGVYVVSAGAWTRSPDFDGNPTNEVSPGDLVYVETGTSNGNSSWVLVTNAPITVGSTALTFSVFSRPGDFEAGAGLTKTGNTFNVGTASTSRIIVNADSLDLASVATPGTYEKVTVDQYGRVLAGSAATFSDITTALGYTPYNATNPNGYTTNTGTVTNVSVVTAAGVSGTVSNPTTTPAITISLGSISPTSVSTGTVSGTSITASTGFTGPVLTASQPNITTVGTLGALTVTGTTTTRGGRAIIVNPTTPLDGDILVSGSTISVFANSAWRQIFPAVYS